MATLATQCMSVGDGASVESSSGGEAFVAMVKPPDLRNRDHLVAVRRLDRASIRAIFVERQMGPRTVIVVDVRKQDAAQMALVNHDHMVKTLAANRADDALDVSILLGRPWRRNDLCDPHNPNPFLKASSVRRVAVSEQVAWRGVPRKRLGDLAGEPTGGRMLGYIQMQNLASSVAKDHAYVQQTKRRGDDHKHIDGGDAVDLIAQEGPPGW